MINSDVVLRRLDALLPVRPHQGGQVNPDDRVVTLTSPAGAYTFSYVTNASGHVVRADIREPDWALRRASLDDAGYWFSHWGSYRGK
jgi:hypothetical protein